MNHQTQCMAQMLIDARCVLDAPTSTPYAKIEACIKLIQLAEMNRLRNMGRSTANHQPA